jgi:hypothetical protein
VGTSYFTKGNLAWDPWVHEIQPTFGPHFGGAFEKTFHDSNKNIQIPTGELQFRFFVKLHFHADSLKLHKKRGALKSEYAYKTYQP